MLECSLNQHSLLDEFHNVSKNSESCRLSSTGEENAIEIAFGSPETKSRMRYKSNGPDRNNSLPSGVPQFCVDSHHFGNSISLFLSIQYLHTHAVLCLTVSRNGEEERTFLAPLLLPLESKYGTFLNYANQSELLNLVGLWEPLNTESVHQKCKWSGKH